MPTAATTTTTTTTSTPKSLRGSPMSVRKDRPQSRRASYQSPLLGSLSSDPAATVAERRRMSRGSRDVRSSSVSHSSSSFAAAMAAANGDATPASQTQEQLDEIARTKTGRISTAKKGKPVHKCDVEGCGKVYTRNEHLKVSLTWMKRHQLNHSQTSMLCDVPKCRKKFHRVDLLQRHKKEDHNVDPVTGMPVEGSSDAAGRSDGHGHDRESSLDARRSTSSAYPPSSVMNGLWDETSVSPSPRVSMDPYSSAEFTHMEPFYQPYGFQAESNIFALPDSSMPDASANFPYDFSGSRSPVSTSSSARIWSQYNSDSRRPSRNPFSPASTEASLSPFGTPFVGAAANEFIDNSTDYFAAQDKCEDTIIQENLSNIIRPQDNYGFQPHLANLDPRYLEAYWQHFDPLFSVINRFTFEASGTSPLVKALMVAIGAYHLDDQIAQNLALTLRETCSKLLHDRLVLDYSHSRLWDLQATFLFEAFSVYCSRRPHSRFSQRFEDLLVGLHSDRDNAFYNKPLSVLDASKSHTYGNNESGQHIQWLHLESKRRLLLACYTLEVQQNLFFGSHRPVSDRNLPMPCSSRLWLASTLEEWQYLAKQEGADTRTMSDAMAASYAGDLKITDSFLSNIAVAHSAHNAMMDPTGCSAISLQPSANTAASHFSVEAASLAMNTPIANILSISGETFVLGQKLATSDQYHEAFEELQKWVNSDTAVPAVQSAIRLFSMALQQGRMGLIYEDWVLVLAALVFWACAMWPQQGKIQSRLSPLPPHGIAELTKKAVAAASEQPAGRGMSWGSARACLAYARQRIDGRIGWLVQDSSGVLTKLIDGRVVDDISGSESGA